MVFSSLQSGNNGLNALSRGTVAALAGRYDDMEFQILFPARHAPVRHTVTLGDGREIPVTEHALSFRLEMEILLHLMTFGLYKPFSAHFRKSFDVWKEADVLLDFSGGDSFTDLYGTSRFVKIALIKLETLWARKRLILMPQTLGPFARGWTRRIARGIVRRASHSFFRDEEGYRAATEEFGADPARCGCIMDMAFSMDASEREDVAFYARRLRGDRKLLIGLNVSGLLYSGGYTQNNMFGLRADYRKTVRALIERFLEAGEDCAVALIPHVLEPGMPVEDDASVCRELAGEFAERYPGRIAAADGYSQADQLKRIIGECDFFVGSRMHACIAAISMRVPTAPIAYSKKFIGVWAMMGLSDCIADPREGDEEAVVAKVWDVFDRRADIAPDIRVELDALYAAIDAAGARAKGQAAL